MANFPVQQDCGIWPWIAVLLPLCCTAAFIGNRTLTAVGDLPPGANHIPEDRMKKIKHFNKTSHKFHQSEIQNSSYTLPVLFKQNFTNDKEPGKHAQHIHNFAPHINNGTKSPFYKRVRLTLTQSKDAVWATITLTFMCIILLLAVAQSKMWKDYHGSEAQGIPLPNFNERVPFKEVMERKVATLRELLAKTKKKKKSVHPKETELESLLQDSDSE